MMNTAAKAIAQQGLETNTLFAGLISRRHFYVIILALAVFFTGFGVVYTKNQQRVLFIKAQTLHQDANKMQTTWGKLLLEQSTLSMQARVERLATEKMNMRMPKASAIVMVKQ